MPVDVTNPSEVEAAAAAAEDVTLLVNNAGVATGLGLVMSDPAVMPGAVTEMEVNYVGLLRMTQAFAPFVSYSASKAAVHSLIHSGRLSLAGQGDAHDWGLSRADRR